MKAIKKFKIDTKDLSLKEKEILKKLILAAELIAPLYLRQKNNKYPGANFYPPDATKEELKEATKRNPAILDPYTFVERARFGGFRAIPFHQRFKKELKLIAKILNEVAKLSEDKNFSRYLKSRAKALLTDDFDQSNILWLNTEKSKIGCVIGPFDRYLDKLFFKKRAYMAWIGILDKKQTKKAGRLKSMVLTSERMFLPESKRAKIPQIKVRIEDTAIFSGLVADFMFVGNNLPSSADLYLIKKYGTLFTIFNPSVKLRFEKWIFPIFRAIFGKDYQKNYSKEELYLAFLRSIVLHETCHSLMRYEDAIIRLQEFFPFFDELYTDILGVKNCGYLFLKDVLTQKDLEAFLITYICRHLHWLSLVSKQPHLIHYATGGAISLNFLLKGKTLKKKRGTFWVDFEKLFICLDQLSHLLEYYMALGNYQEAKEFVKKYGSFDIFKNFSSRLAKVSKKEKV